MEIQEISIEEIEEISELWLKLAELMEPYSELNELNETADEEALEGFQKLYADDRYTIFKGTKEERNIGFMVLKKDQQSSRKMKHYTKISDLFIKEQHRNQGHGSQFLAKAEEWADEQGCEHLKISSEWENKKARKFYKDNNYKEKQVEYFKKI